MTVTVRVQGVTELQHSLAGAPATLEAEAQRTMQAALLLLESDMRRHAPRDTGQLAGSIHHTITGTGASLTGHVGPSARHGLWVETGRKPGKYPPIAALAGWARRHGIENPFLVARAIARRGIKPHPYIEPAWHRHQATIVRMFEQIGQRVAGHIAGGGR